MTLNFSNVTNKHLSPERYIKYAFHLINTKIFPILDICMAPPFEQDFKYPPIFIIGAPRSGSTLLCQVLTDAFDVAYLCNYHCDFFGMPAVAERLKKPLKKRKKSDYSSKYGKVEGIASPAECGEWWYRFFPRDPAYVTLNTVNRKKMQYFRRSLLALTSSTSKPVLLKNLYASIRLGAISKIVPEALYIVITRNEFYNACSILEGRMQALGCYDTWWSVPPSDVKKLKKLPPEEQAVQQIRGIQRDINTAIQDGSIDKKNILQIKYETFCTDVHGSMKNIESFFSNHNVQISRKFDVPTEFTIDTSTNIENEFILKLQHITSYTEN